MRSRVRDKQAHRLGRDDRTAGTRHRRTIRVSVTAVAVLVLAGLVGFGVYRIQRDSAGRPSGAPSASSGIRVSDGAVPVDIYLDYLCPACRQFLTSAQGTLDALVADRRIALSYHVLAVLDGRSAPRGYSTRAGSAAGCAADGGKFLPYTAALFAQQPAEGSAGLSDDQLVQLGAGVGLIDPAFARCERALTYRSWVATNTARAAGAGVSGTPTVLVAGDPIRPTVAALAAAVAAAD